MQKGDMKDTVWQDASIAIQKKERRRERIFRMPSYAFLLTHSQGYYGEDLTFDPYHGREYYSYEYLDD